MRIKIGNARRGVARVPTSRRSLSSLIPIFANVLGAKSTSIHDWSYSGIETTKTSGSFPLDLIIYYANPLTFTKRFESLKTRRTANNGEGPRRPKPSISAKVRGGGNG